MPFVTHSAPPILSTFAEHEQASACASSEPCRGAHPDVPRGRHRPRNGPDQPGPRAAGPARDGALSRAAAERPGFACSRTAPQMRCKENRKRESHAVIPFADRNARYFTPEHGRAE
jgi:hypothetical protein